MSTAFARDYHMHGEIAATRDGRILGLRARVLADHGAFNATAQPTKFPAGFFHIFTGSYDMQAAHCQVTGGLHEQGPGRGRLRLLVPHHRGGVPGRADGRPAGRASSAWTRPSCACRTCCGPSSSPTPAPTGWEYDSGDYPRALRLALDLAGYDELRREQAERRERGEYMGIGLSFFTEGVGAGPRKHMDILGLGMADGADLRVHPTGKAVLGISVQTQGQGHETTFAQIVAHELGLSRTTWRWCTATPTGPRSAWAPTGPGPRRCPAPPPWSAARKVRERARIVAAAMLEAAPATWSGPAGPGRSGATRSRPAAIAEIAMAAHSALELPAGSRATWTRPRCTTRRT